MSETERVLYLLWENRVQTHLNSGKPGIFVGSAWNRFVFGVFGACGAVTECGTRRRQQCSCARA